MDNQEMKKMDASKDAIKLNDDKAEKKVSWFKKAMFFFSGDTKGMTHFKDPVSAYQARPKMWIVNLVFLILFVIVLVCMCNYVGVWQKPDRPISWKLVQKRVGNFFTPDWNYFFGTGAFTQKRTAENPSAYMFMAYAFKEGVVYNCLVTIGITIVGTAFGFLLAIPFGFLASHKLFGKGAFVTEFILILIRTFPELLLALFFVTLSGTTWVTAILCLSIHSIGMVGKLFADQLDENDLEALEALDAQGANKVQRVALAVVPQVTPSFLSVGLYRLDINLRTATTIGIVLAQSAGIGYSILLDIAANNYHHLGADTLGIIIMVVGVDLFSSWLRKKLV